MTGDPKVLAGLQQAYLKLTSHPKDIGDMALLQLQWEDHYGVIAYRPFADVDAEIRAWTPPPAEPSLEQRVAELERAQLHTDQSVGTLLDSTAMLRLTDDTLSNDVQSLHERLRVFEESAQRPEPTAPDDPVCANPECGHEKYLHIWNDDYQCIVLGCLCTTYVPAPLPAPDLDPVRVEAAARAAWDSRNFRTPWGKVNGPLRAEFIKDADIAITTYLNGGGA